MGKALSGKLSCMGTGLVLRGYKSGVFPQEVLDLDTWDVLDGKIWV